jgi:Uma2 family endonuclease
MTGMGTTTGLMTFAEFERLPEHEEPYKLELLDGELIRMPPAKLRHMKVAIKLNRLLDRDLDRLHRLGQCSDLGAVYIETGFRLGGHFLIPDVSVTHAGQAQGDYLEGAPALAIEVISESNTVKAMHRKVLAYFEHGAREVWVFHPSTRSVTVHFGEKSIEVRGILTSALFPDLAIDLAEIFAV